MYAAYNRIGDLICDGYSYDEVYWEARSMGWESEQFCIFKVTA